MRSWYVLAAAAGSTLGALALALVARKLGKDGICKFAGEKQFDKLQKRLSHRAAAAIAIGALAPPPFPYTVVVAVASAVERSLPEILITNFIARAARFAILAYLAMRFGKQVMAVAQSEPFRWTVIGFTDPMSDRERILDMEVGPQRAVEEELRRRAHWALAVSSSSP